MDLRRTRHGSRWVALLGVFVLLLSACAKGSGGGGTPAAGGSGATGKIRIGAALSLTGNLAAEAKLLKAGYDLWEGEVNQRGGIQVGNKKYTVEMVYMNDESSADKAAALTERLITTDKVDFVFSPYGSGNVFAASAIAERHRKVMINAGGTAGNIYTRGFKYFFSAWATGDEYTKGLFEVLAGLNPKPQSLAVLWKNDLGNREATKAAPERAGKTGINVVYNESFNPGTLEFATAFAVIKNSNPDLVIFGGQAPEMLAALRQMKAAGVRPKLLFNTVAVTQPDFPKNAGPDSEGMLGATWFFADLNHKDPFWGDTATYVKMFKDKNGFEPDYHAEIGSVAGVLLAQALTKAGTTETEAVRKALTQLDLETISGPVKFDETGKNGSAQMVLGQIQNGKYVPIWPKVEGAKPIVYPMPAWK